MIRRLICLWKHDRATRTLWNAWLYLAHEYEGPDTRDACRLLWKSLKAMEQLRETL